jgi:hypothetical protein
VELAAHLRVQAGALRALVDSVLEPQLDVQVVAAMGTFRWPLLVELLAAYDEGDVLPVARRIPIGAVEACRKAATSKYGPEHRVSRILAFLSLENQTGPSARPASDAPMNPPSKGVAPPVRAGGGSVTTYDDVSNMAPDASGGPGWFGFDYQGPEAPSTGWLQFTAREAETYDAAGQSLGFVTSHTTQVRGQPERRRWGTAAAPIWHLDAQSDTAPFYEARNSETGKSGAHTTWAERTAIWDRPQADTNVTAAAFSTAAVARVVQRIRVHAYLVRGMQVLYENTMVVEYDYTGRAASPGPKNQPGNGAAASRVRPEHHAALLRRFPDWTFYPR